MHEERNVLYFLINPFNPLVECALAFVGVKPFIHAVFRPFSLSEWKFEIALFHKVDTCHAVLDTASQGQASLEPSPSPLTGEGERSSDEGDIKYIQTTALDTVSQEHANLPLSKGEDRMLNERKRINSILGEGSSCRVNDRTRHTALDAVSQEHANFEPSPSPLTGEGERSSDEGDIKYIQTTALEESPQFHASHQASASPPMPGLFSCTDAEQITEITDNR